MAGGPRRAPSLAAALAVLAYAPVAAAAIGQEWVGGELIAAALGSGRLDQPQGPGWQLRASLGPGLRLRFLRHRWGRAYWTPVQAGFLATLGDRQSYGATVGTEVGAVLPAPDQQALALGLAVEGGGVGTVVPGLCDGWCVMSGVGLVPSLAARWIVRDQGALSLGVVVRVMVPVHQASFSRPNLDHQLYSVVLLGLDVGVGSER